MENPHDWSESYAHLCIALLSVLMMVLSTTYGLGTLARPGAGMYPFVAGLLVFPLSLSLLIGSFRRRRKASAMSGRQIGNFVLFLCTCAFWILAMPLLGYPLVTLIATLLIAKIMKLEGLLKPLLLSVGTALFIYLLFDVWLYIDLPRGFLG
jgi:putative tricarboxylic transport membrane protein